MSLFGNSTFSTIFYIFSVIVTFCITIKLRERLNLYIENIPEKERSFCEKFLSNQVIQIILFAGFGFVLLKFIIDPAMVILFPASITTTTIVGGAYEEEENEPQIVGGASGEEEIEPQIVEPVIYESDELDKKSNQMGGLNDQEEEEPLIDVDALIEQNAAKVQDTEDQQAELINQLQTLQTKLVEQQKQQQELVQQQQQQKQQQELIQQQQVQQQNQQQTNQTVQQQNQQQTNQTVQQQVVNTNQQQVQQGGEDTTQQNKQQTNQTVQQQVQQQNKQQTNQTVQQQNKQQTNQQKQQQDILNDLPNKAELPIEKPVIDIFEGGKKMGRPRKIKSLAKQALGKKNVWAQAVKQAREALGIQGFQPVKKGGLLYKTAQAYYTTLKN